MNDLTPPPAAEAADTPSTEAPAAAPAAPAAEAEPAATTAPEPRRTLKLVLTLQPVDAGYRALVAVGTDGCDPLLRSLAVPDLAAALGQAAAIAAEAVDLWRAQPRYPAAASAKPARSTAPAQPAAPAPAGPMSAPVDDPAGPPQPRAAAPQPAAPRSQLSLFGDGQPS